ncbi:MAG: penicillin-binding transpeptidase domain-containing protein [Oscillospiraceae bacterium]|nr:penicillin-binding transpeptidase domain-containing protein [Oscillospiraceae bacterium]
MIFRSKIRILAAVISIGAVLLVFIARLFDVQIINGAVYAASLQNTDEYTVPIEAARGSVLDRNGNPLAVSRPGNAVVFDAVFFPPAAETERRNEIIADLVSLLEKNDEKWDDSLPLKSDGDGNLYFEDGRDADISYLKSQGFLNLNSYATALNCYDALVEKFSLEDYEAPSALKISSVYFGMGKAAFSKINSYLFARNVSIETIVSIKERSDKFEGVEIKTVPVREYENDKIAPHILGVVGPISESVYNEKRDELAQIVDNPDISPAEKEKASALAYKITDQMGKSGIESAFEDYLRGVPGYKKISVGPDGNVTGEKVAPPVTGDTVILTIDKDLQEVVQNALEKRVRELSVNSYLPAAGAAVVMDVNNGDILAAASYPSYSISEYYSEYDKLAGASGSPLWNRAFSSVYEPGSTMKLSVALAALEEGPEGGIGYDTHLLCEGKYECLGQTFSCLGTHGYVNIVTAIEKSCNIFFYKTAEKLGITKMNTYASMLGLGSKTGVDLPEAEGILAGIAYRSSQGKKWLPGDTFQAAIGQSDNLFTPLQLCNYCATIANGGTRYVPHIVKSVKSPDSNEVKLQNSPQVAVNTNISESSLDIVRQGMLAVAVSGTCRTAFSDLNVKAGAKSGTSQTVKIINGNPVKGNNGFVVSYAPFDNPRIAVAVVVENVDSGSATANIAAEIYKYFFSKPDGIQMAQSANKLLK